MARPKGSLNKKTVFAREQIAAARRKLAREHGSDPRDGGVAESTALLLVELTRSVYDDSIRLNAAKELAALEYARMAPIRVDKHGEPVELGAGDQQQLAFEMFDIEVAA